MYEAGAIILAGGRSSRMGSPKAALDWHGSTLLRRVTGLALRSVDGPVVVVRAPGQPLPALDARVEIAQDAREGRGPVEGLAAGLAAIGDRASVAFASSTDVPLLHPAFIRRVLGAFAPDVDVVLPDVGGFRQPLAAAYRVGLLALIGELLDAGRVKPAFLYERCRVLPLDGPAMLRDPALAALDPHLRSVSNLNEPADYERARALAGPEVVVRVAGGERTVRAWSLGELAGAIGLTLDSSLVATLNGDLSRDPELPLVAGDAVGFTAADPARSGR